MAANGKLFSETTADTFNVGQNLSDVTTPVSTSRFNILGTSKNKVSNNWKNKSFIFNTFSIDEKSTSEGKIMAIVKVKGSILNCTILCFSNFLTFKDVYSPKLINIEPAVLTMNPKVMETWLNDVLVDAKQLELRSCYLKSDKRKPINQYGKLIVPTTS